MFLRSSEEQRLAGQRTGTEEGLLGGTGTVSWEDRERIRAWRDQGAQVECGCAEPEHKYVLVPS